MVDRRGQARAWLVMWAGVAIVTLLAIYRLRQFPYHLSWSAAWEGIRPLLGETLWAALKVWAFWGWATLVLGGLALRIEPELEQFDAILVGAGGVWILAFLLGNLLGPIRLFYSATLWGLLALGTAWLWRNPPRHRKLQTPSSGQKLAAFAVLLLAVSYLPLQLGSPVVPFMDVLSYPSSAQRILTFGIYDPFNNDPYGCWGPYAQTPALELFYSALAMGSHTHPAALAESAAMLPMAALMIFATWRLGKTVFDDTAGGVAGLLLFFTCLFRRAQGMRGTAVDFALVALGLAFFMSRGSRLLFAAGALMLGCSIASHAIDGALAMIVAGVGVILWLAESDPGRFAAGVVALAGAALVALPEYLIALGHRAPYPIIPAGQLAGVAAICLAARWMPPDAALRDRRLVAVLNRGLIAFFILAVLYRHAANAFTLYQQVADNLPLLTLLCFAGLIAAFVVQWPADQTRYSGLVAVALLLGIAGEYFDPVLRTLSHTPAGGMMTSDIRIKLWDYWCPFFLTLPAGYLFALAYDRWSRPGTLFILLALLIYPWRQAPHPLDYDSLEHSISEHWAFNLDTASLGYWTGHTDRRWLFGPTDMNLIKVLDDEVAAGRITPATHILHLCTNVSQWWALLEFPVLTGINDDPIEDQHDPNNLWEGGSRVRGMNDLGRALAAAPPYILEQVSPPPGTGDPPPGYQTIYESLPVKLYRRNDLAEVNIAANRWHVYPLLPGLVLWVAAGLLVLGRRGLPAVRAHDEARPVTSFADAGKG
ncbi:MAG: hypothetical protein JO121_23525 [Deltaproteobacteria bacterium]|nr:hypothetical protein [Deltaproteobacteria bacterium]